MKQFFDCTALVASLLLLTVVGAHGQEVGTVAAVEGEAQIVRGGTRTPAQVGSAVAVGDTLHTGRPGRLRVVFQDDSVNVLGDDSQMVISAQTFEPERGVVESALRLVQGKLRAIASEYYHQTGASYRVETPTAVAGVRGTEFIVSVHDDISEIVGVSGMVTAARIGDPISRGVAVRPQEITVVAAGGAPSKPRQLNNPAFDSYIDSVTFIGGGEARGTSGFVPEPDRAGASTPVNAPILGNPLKGPDPSSLIGQPPGVVNAVGGRLHIEF